MKITIGTAKLQALLNKAVKGAGCNKLIPSTSLIAIKVENGVLTLTTNDDENYLTIEDDLSGKEDFYVAVQVDLLAKLVSKMTCDNVTLEVTDSCLNVNGNGSYQIELEHEDDGAQLVLPNPIDGFDKRNKVGVVDSSVITTTLASIKPALATTDDIPCFACYYVGDSIVATDGYTASDYAKGFLQEPKLIRSVVMDLLGLLTGEISVYEDNGKMLFESEGGSVYCSVPNGIEQYSIAQIKTLVTQEFDYSCKVTKSSLLNLLDRIALFVGVYDNGKITLVFDADGLEVNSKYANEVIPYSEDVDINEFVCIADINTLITQVKAQRGDEFTIEFGKENVIKFVDGDIVSVVALLEE